jgi:TolB protein
VSGAARVVLSTDGTRAAFDASNDIGVTRIFVVELATGVVSQLTDHPGDALANDSFPTWVGSTEVGFSSDSGGADQVYEVSAGAARSSGTLVLPSAVEPWHGPN